MPTYLQIKVQLPDVTPAIWRRFLVRDDGTFADLHEAIQAAGPWSNGHTYLIRPSLRTPVLVQPAGDDPWEGAMIAELTLLEAYFSNAANKRCVYIYDLGANWVHNVRLERRVKDRKRFARRLIDGSRAFPKEDMDGISGYREDAALVKAGPPKSARARNRLEWLRGWDPDRFDLEIAKASFDQT